MKALYVTACMLFVIAIVIVGYAQIEAGKVVRVGSKAIESKARTGSDAGMAEANAIVKKAADTSDRLFMLSLFFAGVGLVSWITSLFGHRKNSVVIPIGLAIIYIAIYLLMV